MLRNLQGILWNALFCAYLLLAAPHVLAAVRGASAEGRVNPALGAVLLAFLLLETAGFHVKIRALYARLGEARGRFQRPVLLYTAWMAHLLITTSSRSSTPACKLRRSSSAAFLKPPPAPSGPGPGPCWASWPWPTWPERGAAPHLTLCGDETSPLPAGRLRKRRLDK